MLGFALILSRVSPAAYHSTQPTVICLSFERSDIVPAGTLSVALNLQ